LRARGSRGRKPSRQANIPPPKICFPATPDLVRDTVLWFITDDKWTREINTRSMFLLHNLILPERAKHQTRENIEDVGNNPGLYLASVVMKDIEECAENKDNFRNLIQKLFDLSGETVKESSTIALRYDINTEQFDIDRAVQKIGNIKEQARFASSLYFDRIASARLRILGWIYHEFYGEWFKDFVKKK
jgi:hypothetical protein